MEIGLEEGASDALERVWETLEIHAHVDSDALNEEKGLVQTSYIHHLDPPAKRGILPGSRERSLAQRILD